MILSENLYPISGPLKEPLLIMEWIIFSMFIELGTIIWIRINTKSSEIKIEQEKAFSILVYGYGIMWIFTVIGDYYMITMESRLFFLNLGRCFQSLAAVGFIYFLENYRIFYKKYLLTIISLIVFLIFLLISILSPTLTGFAAIGYWPFFLLFFIFYLKKFRSFFTSETLAKIAKFEFFNFLIGMVLLSIGFGLSTDFMRLFFGLEFRFIGDILQLISIIFLYVFIIILPSFSEYDWKEKIDEVIIMHKSGLLIYRKGFRSEEDTGTAPIISGTLTTLKLLIEQVTKEKGTSIIEKEGKTVIIQPGKYIIGVLIMDEKLVVLKKFLDKLVEKIENIYSGVLPNWKGDLKIFSPIEYMVKSVFT